MPILYFCKMRALRIAYVAFFILITCLFIGCATITNGPYQEVFLTTPTGESIIARVNNQTMRIPAKVEISRKLGATIQVLAGDNPGYKDSKLIIVGKEKTSAQFWLNFLAVPLSPLGASLSSTTDSKTGGMYKYANPTFYIPIVKDDKDK